jgi:hypothetical protein
VGDIGKVAQRPPQAVEASHDKRVTVTRDGEHLCNCVRPSRLVPLAFSSKITPTPASVNACR